MAHLTVAEVDHIALLARLSLSDEEKARYAQQLSAILDYAAELAAIDVADIPPTATVLDIHNVMRPSDETCCSMPREDALKNAPRTDGASFEVQATFKDE
ncbi:MAG: Asp-tRNA(Asn)/Glu-tRNA(Gln) amidotransferase subunit GatC [Chloroflexi bacterium]|nr:Asp-tRNA(Asn)/Glu-tRNA(Gln) amidotransferase subunit GatC [Chloroflexota bacterium]